MNDSETVDRATWKRYDSKGGRCLVCGQRGPVTVTMRATLTTGERGGEELAREQFAFCNDHAIMRFGEALIRLNGGTVK